MSKTYSYDSTTGTYALTGDVVNGSYTSAYVGFCSCWSTSITCKNMIKIEAVDKDGTINRVSKATNYNSPLIATTKAQAESNEIDSGVKTMNDDWYKNNLTSVASKISTTAGYCNDRTTVETDGGIGKTKTAFSAYDRVVNEYTPSFKCSNESNDLFTMTTVSYGNKKLSYPVGSITADELAYAGSLSTAANYQVYTQVGVVIWTMSPSRFSGSMAYVFYINGVGQIGDSNLGGQSNGYRPVIALNSTAIVTSGDGSLASPYIVE